MIGSRQTVQHIRPPHGDETAGYGNSMSSQLILILIVVLGHGVTGPFGELVQSYGPVMPPRPALPDTHWLAPVTKLVTDT